MNEPPAPAAMNGALGAGANAGASGGDGLTSSDFNNGNSDGSAIPVLMKQPDASVGVNETTNPDDPKCGGVRFMPMIKMEVIPGNILLIADQSQSMQDNFASTGKPKWQEARDAVANAIQPLQDNVNVGAVLFPDTTGCDVLTDSACSCNVPPFSSSPPQISFAKGAQFLNTWNGKYTAQTLAFTPLAEALTVADKALTDNLPTLTGTTAVVVVTDGEPNCVLDETYTVDDKVAALTPLPTKWLGMGIKTYVIGLPGADTQDAITILDAVANAGGTTKHIPATDPATVQSELSTIIGESVMTNFDSCMIPLDKQPPNLDDVNLVVMKDGMELKVDRDLGASGGWTIDQDAKNVVLQGTFCELAKMGEYQGITVVFGCVMAPPLPPPPPPPPPPM